MESIAKIATLPVTSFMGQNGKPSKHGTEGWVTPMAECPCESCESRKYLAAAYNIRVWGETCPYPCKRWKEWKEKENENR